MSYLKLFLLGFLSLNLSCAGIKTRNQLKLEGVRVERSNANTVQKEVQVTRIVEKPVAGETIVSVIESTPADPVSQKLEMKSELRRLSGELQDIKDARLMEVKSNQEFRLAQDQKLQLMQSKFVVYEQSIEALEEEISHLKALKAPSKKKSTKGIFERAEDHMINKDWKKAILEFENYRKKYPRGRRISLATYNIGVSFQELGLKEEAKAFFQETVEKYPKTTAFNKASYRLKQLK